jgi:tetratricopeptide (TPR) repeat protein
MTRLLITVLGLALALGGCAKQPTQSLCPCPDGKTLDQELMIVLSSARALHHQADIHLEQGEVEHAVEAVRQILSLKLDATWPEAEEVRLDATARLAKLLLGRGDEAAALEAADKAIAAGPRASFYLSNLHSVRGEILEHRAKRLDREGKRDDAKRSGLDAIAAYEQSIRINKQLQQQLLQQGGRR